MKKVLSAVIVTLLALVLAACTTSVEIKDAKVVPVSDIVTISANGETETNISFVIVEKGAKAPSAEQVVAGVDYDKIKIVEKGVFAAGKNVKKTLENGDFTAYFVGVKDKENSKVVSVDFTVLKDIEVIEVTLEQLKTELAEAKKIDTELYTRATVSVLNEVIVKAELVVGTTGSTNDDYKKAYDDLKSAHKLLTLIELPNTNVDRNGIYTSSISAAKNLNPLTSTDSTEGDLMDYFRSSFYETVLDWDRAVEDGIASNEWDFSKITSEDEMSKFFSTRRLGMAADFLYGINSQTNATKKNAAGTTILDVQKAKETTDTKFRVEIRKDLEFVYGNTGKKVAIDTSTIEYSLKQYLNKDAVNDRANLIYEDGYVHLLNGEEYLKGEVTWGQVGFKVIDKYTFEIETAKAQSLWDFSSMLNLIDFVEEEGFEKGKPVGSQRSNYGNVDNLPASYGRYILKSWESNKELSYERNKVGYLYSDELHIKTLKIRVIEGQGASINEFKDGKLDVAGVSGTYFPEFKDDPRLKVSKSNSFYRLDLSIQRPDGKSPIIMKNADFRRALFLAVDREEFVTNIVAPAEPLLSLASNIHQVTEDAKEAFHSSPEHKQVISELGLSPETAGYNAIKAKELFDLAYNKLVTDGNISVGEKAKVSFVYYDTDSNKKIADFLKGQFEQVFGSEKFELTLQPESSDVYKELRDGGNFDLLFAGLSGGTFDVLFIYDFVYVQAEFYYGKGFGDLGTIQVKPFQIEYKVEQILNKTEAERTAEEKALLLKLDGNYDFVGTFEELSHLYNKTSLFTGEYEGRTRDLSAIAATLERVLLDEGLTVPLFSNISAAVYSERVLLLNPYWNIFVSWGGLNARVVLK